MELKDLILQLDQFGIDGECVVICYNDDEITVATNVTDYHRLDELLTKGYNDIIKQYIISGQVVQTDKVDVP